MTPGQAFGAKLIGTVFGLVVFLIIVYVLWMFGPAIFEALTDDGHRAYPPSAFVQRR